jgi:hypothetical protein
VSIGTLEGCARIVVLRMGCVPVWGKAVVNGVEWFSEGCMEEVYMEVEMVPRTP